MEQRAPVELPKVITDEYSRFPNKEEGVDLDELRDEEKPLAQAVELLTERRVVG